MPDLTAIDLFAGLGRAMSRLDSDMSLCYNGFAIPANGANNENHNSPGQVL